MTNNKKGSKNQFARGFGRTQGQQQRHAKATASNSTANTIERLIEPLLLQGQKEQALAQLKLLQQSRSSDPRIGVLMGNLLCEQGDIQTALACYRQALHHDPTCVDALINLANLEAIRGNKPAASEHYNIAASIQPDYAPLLANYTNFLLQTEQHQQACPWLERWLKQDPHNAEILLRLGVCMTELDQQQRARQCLQQALAIEPRNPAVLGRLATLELMANHTNTEMALDLADQAHKLDPASPQINLILGLIHLAATHYEQALHHLQLAAQDLRQPQQALHNLAFAYFGLNKRELGYQHHEIRSQLAKPLKPHARSSYTPFDKADASGHLVLLSEQGFGDTLQFVRYAPWLLQRRMYQRITLYVQAQLVSLLQTSMAVPAILVIESADQAPASLKTKNVLPLLSCPHQFGENPSDPDLHGPYLKAPAELVKSWQGRIRVPHPDQRLVAICWQGNPEAERTHNRGRSMPLELLLKLAEISGIKLVSLQKGPGSEQLTPEISQRHFVSCQEQITAAMAFEDSAAILACCDVMITTDTGMAHLCGALGKPLWLLLSHRPDWRWGPKGESTFWYPHLTTFQQPSPGDWPGVIEAVAARLKNQE